MLIVVEKVRDFPEELTFKVNSYLFKDFLIGGFLI